MHSSVCRIFTSSFGEAQPADTCCHGSLTRTIWLCVCMTIVLSVVIRWTVRVCCFNLIQQLIIYSHGVTMYGSMCTSSVFLYTCHTYSFSTIVSSSHLSYSLGNVIPLTADNPCTLLFCTWQMICHTCNCLCCVVCQGQDDLIARPFL